MGNGGNGRLVLAERSTDRVLCLTLNRPEKRNALSKALLGQLAGHLEAAEADDGVVCTVLAGAGPAFSAGADIKDMTARGVDSYLDPERLGAWTTIERFAKPLIGAVNGYAFGGGCELALLCDFLVAAEGARFGLPEVTIGAIPGDGGTQRLPRAVGPALAARMVFTGEPIDAATAERYGLVAEVVAGPDCLPRTLEIASVIAGRAPKALALAKGAMRRAAELPLSRGLTYERDASRQAFATGDRREGMAAFLEKRPPRFSGR
jgi:enoyl-CoA hydratase/carnithine racemase